MHNTEKIFPPSKIIKDKLAERGLNQADLAAITGRNAGYISNYLAKEKISPEFAQELALVLGETPEYWLSVENKYRLAQLGDLDESVIKRNSFIQDYPLKEMQKRGWISKTDDLSILEPELNKFFEESESFQHLEQTTSFKRTVKEQNLNTAEKAWLYRARQLAKILSTGSYNEAKLESLFTLLRKAAKSSKAVHKVAELLSRYGIRFVVIEPLPKAKIDGAAFWLDSKSPVIALSLRFDNVGSFWFALIHELIHIKYKDSFSLDNLQDAPVDEIEERANREAANFFIPNNSLEDFINSTSPYYSRDAINNFAMKLNIHPGIIVGQLQKREEIGWDKHRDSLVKVRELATMTAFTDGWGHPTPMAK